MTFRLELPAEYVAALGQLTITSARLEHRVNEMIASTLRTNQWTVEVFLADGGVRRNLEVLKNLVAVSRSVVGRDVQAHYAPHLTDEAREHVRQFVSKARKGFDRRNELVHAEWAWNAALGHAAILRTRATYMKHLPIPLDFLTGCVDHLQALWGRAENLKIVLIELETGIDPTTPFTADMWDDLPELPEMPDWPKSNGT